MCVKVRLEGKLGKPQMACICFSFILHNCAKYMCGESCEFSSLTFVDIKPSYYRIPVKRGEKIRRLFFAFYASKSGKKLVAFFQSPD